MNGRHNFMNGNSLIHVPVICICMSMYCTLTFGREILITQDVLLHYDLQWPILKDCISRYHLLHNLSTLIANKYFLFNVT